MREISFVDEAQEDLADAVEFLEKRSPGLRDKFRDEVRRALTRLQDNPRVGPEIAPGIRKLRLRRFPYDLTYEILQMEVRVLTVSHHRREPRHWIGRG